jgi:uncharacterized membrane protein YfcA
VPPAPDLVAWLVAPVAVVAGAIAAVAGFGIGSLLTPLLTVRFGASVAVALVAIPHAVATLVRFVRLRRAVDRDVLLTFGLASAAGGLVGAVGHAFVQSGLLAVLLGVLLLFVGIGGLTGLTARLRFRGGAGIVAGVASGLFGGLVGNQGGIRSGALLGTDLRRDAFVATSTAVGLVVDAVRIPIYLSTAGDAIAANLRVVVVAAVGTVVGTLVGGPILARIPEERFRTIVSIVVAALGVLLIAGVR